MRSPVRLVEGEAVARFISERLGFGLCPPYSTLGIERDGEIVAGCLFNCFEGAAVHVSAAGSGWTRGFMRALGEYVYNQLGCSRMTLTSENADVIAYAKRLGGKVEGVLRDQFGPGRDATIVGVLRDEYLYLNRG